jgi:hypothetical protein
LEGRPWSKCAIDLSSELSDWPESVSDLTTTAGRVARPLGRLLIGASSSSLSVGASCCLLGHLLIGASSSPLSEAVPLASRAGSAAASARF